MMILTRCVTGLETETETDHDDLDALRDRVRDGDRD